MPGFKVVSLDHALEALLSLLVGHFLVRYSASSSLDSRCCIPSVLCYIPSGRAPERTLWEHHMLMRSSEDANSQQHERQQFYPLALLAYRDSRLVDESTPPSINQYFFTADGPQTSQLDLLTLASVHSFVHMRPHVPARTRSVAFGIIVGCSERTKGFHPARASRSTYTHTALIGV